MIEIVSWGNKSTRQALDQFVKKVAKFGAADVRRLMGDAGIVRNKMKIDAAIENARRVIEVAKELGSFDRYVWGFVGGKPIRRMRRTMKDIPATTLESDALSKDLKRRGFKFVGSTIVYAFMQAVGLVDDHVTGCARAR